MSPEPPEWRLGAFRNPPASRVERRFVSLRWDTRDRHRWATGLRSSGS